MRLWRSTSGRAACSLGRLWSSRALPQNGQHDETEGSENQRDELGCRQPHHQPAIGLEPAIDDGCAEHRGDRARADALEERHDSYMEENPLPSPFVDSDGEVPTADTIAAELEKFLASRPNDEFR